MLDPAHAALGRSRRHAWRILAGILIAALIVGAVAYVVFGIGVEALLDHILTLPSWLIVLLVFLLPALEASAFVGVVLPGEIAVLLGGVAAGRGSVNFAAVLVGAGGCDRVGRPGREVPVEAGAGDAGLGDDFSDGAAGVAQVRGVGEPVGVDDGGRADPAPFVVATARAWAARSTA